SDTPEVSIRYRYIVWRNFLDYLNQHHGHASVLGFIHEVNRNASNFDAAFAAAFGAGVADRAKEFESAVLARSYVPEEAP
ncbi:MAG: hypothetical protein R2762_19245, partial [Bryobacteraceae bacterium]